jgi:hypothetical protein
VTPLIYLRCYKTSASADYDENLIVFINRTIFTALSVQSATLRHEIGVGAGDTQDVNNYE